MSAQLHIKFGANPGDAYLAPLRIDVVGSDLEIVSSDVYHMHDSPTVTVEPGSYLVRGLLPSGELITAQAVVEEGTSMDVVLEPIHPSPHEHLAWGYYMRANPLLEDSSASRRVTESLLETYAPGPITYRVWNHTGNGHTWTQVLEGSVGADDDPNVQRLYPSEDPRGLGVISLDPNSLPMPGPWDSQYWLALQGDWFSPRFIALPITTQPSRVLLRFVGREAGDTDPLQVIVDTQHAIVESLLNLITAGDYSVARSIWGSRLPEAEALFRTKIMDRMAAAVGGYFLLLAGDLQRMHDWSSNLNEWFPALPDGAVIHAWFLLQSGGDPNVARDHLIAAASRGVPFYTCGLRLLVDGLMLFQQREETQAKRPTQPLRKAWEFIAPYAAAADWTQPTTTAFGEMPAHPQPRETKLQTTGPRWRSPEERLLDAIFQRPEPAARIVEVGNEVIVGGVRLRKRQLAASSNRR